MLKSGFYKLFTESFRKMISRQNNTAEAVVFLGTMCYITPNMEQKTMSRTDIDLKLEEMRRCNWAYFAVTPLARIRTNFTPGEEQDVFYTFPGRKFMFMAAFRSRFPSRDVRIECSGAFAAESVPVFNVVYPEEAALVPDRLGGGECYQVLPANTAGSFLVTLTIPEDTVPGNYTLRLKLVSGTHQPADREIELEVLPAVPEAEIPEPHMILWPHWAVFAKRFGVKLWSDEFFEKATPYLKAMRTLGMNGIMASIVHDPFHYPLPEAFYDYNHYPTMIRWICDDGKWSFDYRIYDRYVKWNMEHGISGEIECHALLPCKNQAPELAWYDKDGGFHTLKTTFDSPVYREVWGAFLTDFMAHNREMGWEKLITICPYDEPDNIESFACVSRLIRKFAPEARVTAAISSESALAVSGSIDIATLHLSVGYSEENEAALLKSGVELRWYNCCLPDWGNTLFNCTLAESYRMAFITCAGKYSGFLRWSVLDWSETVLTDPAFNWPTGDTLWIYPGEKAPVYSLRAVAWLCGRDDLQLLLNKYESAPDVLKQDIMQFIQRLGRKGKLNSGETIAAWQKEIYHLVKRSS